MGKWSMYRRRGTAAAVRTQADDYISAVEAAGGAITNDQRVALNALWSQIVIAGLWDKLYDICPCAGNNLAASLIRLKDPSGGISPLTNHNLVGGDYVFAGGSAGWTFNGTTKYLSGLVPTDVLGLDCTILIDAPAVSSSATVVPIGALPVASREWGWTTANGSGNTVGRAGTDTTNAASSGYSAGRYAVVSRSSTDLALYRNHVSLGTQAGARASSAASQSLFVGARNNIGTADSFAACRITMVITGLGLTLGELTQLDSIVAAVQAGLGRA